MITRPPEFGYWVKKEKKEMRIQGLELATSRRLYMEGREREEREGEFKNTRIPGVPPVPSTQLSIQTGVSAPAASGGGVGPTGGPLFV